MRTITHRAVGRRRAPVRRTLVVILSFTAVALLPSGSSGSPGRAQQEQRPRFDASVARVRVDVIVTAGGDFVDDLRGEDFVLFEDGVEQTVLGVQLVDLAADGSGGPADGVAGDEGAVPSSARADAVLPARPEDQVALGGHEPTDLAAVVYVVNGLGVGCRGLSRFARQWGRMYDDDVEQVDVPHSVLMIDVFGYVHELASFTRDVAELRAAAERVRGKPFLGGEVEEIYEQNFGNLCMGGSPIHNPAERTFELLTAITDALAARPGRKALVWVSPDISMAGPTVRRGITFGPFDYSRAGNVRELFERSANSAGVSVYGVDPDLVTWYTSVGGAWSSAGPVDTILDDPFVGSFSAAPNYLSQVSRNTGGRPFIRWGDIPKALRQVQRETARFYLITYAPPDPPDDGDYHEIRVLVRRSGVEVRARDGYYDISDGERLRRAEAARDLLAQPSPLLEGDSR